MSYTEEASIRQYPVWATYFASPSLIVGQSSDWTRVRRWFIRETIDESSITCLVDWESTRCQLFCLICKSWLVLYFYYKKTLSLHIQVSTNLVFQVRTMDRLWFCVLCYDDCCKRFCGWVAKLSGCCFFFVHEHVHEIVFFLVGGARLRLGCIRQSTTTTAINQSINQSKEPCIFCWSSPSLCAPSFSKQSYHFSRSMQETLPSHKLHMDGPDGEPVGWNILHLMNTRSIHTVCSRWRAVWRGWGNSKLSRSSFLAEDRVPWALLEDHLC